MSIFSKVPVRKPKLTPHSFRHSVKTSTQFGFEMPTFLQKAVPGDIYYGNQAHKLDTAPLATKLMQEFRVKMETFFVPTRIMWKQFEEFFVEEENEIIHPYVNPNLFYNVLASSLNQFFDFADGVNVGVIAQAAVGPKSLWWSVYGNTLNKVSKNLDALRLYAYFFVMKEYYWDENLQDFFIDYFDVDRFKSVYQQAAGNMTTFFTTWFASWVYYHLTGEWGNISSKFEINATNVDTAKMYARGFVFRGYPKDYFVGSLPWKQKGNTVYIPSSQQSEIQFYIQNEHPSGEDIATAPTNLVKFQDNGDASVPGYKGVNPVASLFSDTTKNSYIRGVTAIGSGVTSIEDFRTAYEVQKWLEINARGGTRYKEQILAHFGIKTKDARLDRPEFMYGYTDVINQGDVFTTYQNENGDGVPGENITKLSAGGVSKAVGYHVTEHGYFLSLYTEYPKALYANGVIRQAMELDKFDYFWPEFEHLGEQEVYNCEVDGAHSNPDGVFGYVPRYAQYKCCPNRVMGEFVGDLKTFTLYRSFNSDAALNGRFIEIDPVYNDLNRCFNVVTSEWDKLYPEIFNNVILYRPMSYFGEPRLVL